MYPPVGMTVAPIQRVAKASSLLSIQVRTYGEAVSELVSLAMLHRFGLDAVQGPPVHDANVESSGLPPGPIIGDVDSWRKIIKENFVDENLFEHVHKADSHSQAELYAHMQVCLIYVYYYMHHPFVYPCESLF